MKKEPREFHDNESENISGESIEGAALIRGRRSLTFLSQMRRLFEGGACLSKCGIDYGPFNDNSTKARWITNDARSIE